MPSDVNATALRTKLLASSKLSDVKGRLADFAKKSKELSSLKKKAAASSASESTAAVRSVASSASGVTVTARSLMLC